MYKKMKAYVQEHHMLTKTDHVMIGVSGGADSICLLFMLIDLKRELGFSLTAVHIHHGLRGKSADEDEQYVRKVCEEQEIELFVYHEDVRIYAAEHGYTEEEAGRELRREILEKICREKDGTKIALAHHKNDNVETVLWNMCRGTGLQGLGGILPVSGVYIRPLLCLSRKEIEGYLKTRGIFYCTDETNMENYYTRNKIRNNVIPYLEEQINTQSISHMADVIENVRLMNEYIESELGKWVEKCICQEKESCVLYKEEYEKLPEFFQKKVLYKYLVQAAEKKKDIEAVHVCMLEDLLNKQVGKKINLPYMMEAHRIYEGIRIVKKQEEEKKDWEESAPDFEMKVFERSGEMVTFPENPYTKWFDCDIIKNTVEIRHRKPGDYIVIDKNGKTQKLKQYFINEKIPQDKRDLIWVVADGQQIMWIVGYRQSQLYQITDKTRKIMEIRLLKE